MCKIWSIQALENSINPKSFEDYEHCFSFSCIWAFAGCLIRDHRKIFDSWWREIFSENQLFPDSGTVSLSFQILSIWSWSYILIWSCSYLYEAVHYLSISIWDCPLSIYIYLRLPYIYLYLSGTVLYLSNTVLYLSKTVLVCVVSTTEKKTISKLTPIFADYFYS